jgi:DNA-binding GntR family transcriptional regulator
VHKALIDAIKSRDHDAIVAAFTAHPFDSAHVLVELMTTVTA